VPVNRLPQLLYDLAWIFCMEAFIRQSFIAQFSELRPDELHPSIASLRLPISAFLHKPLFLPDTPFSYAGTAAPGAAVFALCLKDDFQCCSLQL
jgi:hypothetical protein